ncbi:MAG: magnesium and cobalt transport protein CorA, partial [Armatimonadetes bacterium]|nr:magnesium and cobalt transport protein CorA [Armatimonadota bacterium]
MTRLAQDISRKAGMPPGSLVHVGGRKAEQARITVVRYNETHYEESEVADVSECLPPEGFEGVTWVNVDGIHDT